MDFFTLFTLGSPFVISVMVAALLKLYTCPKVHVRSQAASLQDTEKVTVEEIKTLAGCHRVVETLHDMIAKDGAGSWPPKTNHVISSWPAALRPYKEIFFELVKLLSQAQPSQEDDVNNARIDEFRARFRTLLTKHVGLLEVKQVRLLKDLSIILRS
jgi:hypothetical protein